MNLIYHPSIAIEKSKEKLYSLGQEVYGGHIINDILFENKDESYNIYIIKKLPKIKGVKEIMYPGQNKFNRYKNNSKKEISIPDIIKKDLETLIS